MQDYQNAELIILNTHPEPLIVADDLKDRIKVFNEGLEETLRHKINRLIDLADGEYLHQWDDDDVYLPHKLSQAIDMIAATEHKACRPDGLWWTPDGGASYERARNTAEASIIWNTESVRKHRFSNDDINEEYGSRLARLQVVDCKIDSPAYIYFWGDGIAHDSGYFNGKLSPKERADIWRANQSDSQPNRVLTPNFGSIKALIEDFNSKTRDS